MLRKLFLLLNIVCIFTNVLASESSIQDKISQKIQDTDADLNIGIKITNLARNEVIFEQNANRYFIPASTLKFITIISLLEHFGKDYKFASRIYRYNRDYYIDIHDPDFKPCDLDRLLENFIKNSGKEITGNLYIIDSKFTVSSLMRGKTHGDTLYCYGAPVSKVHINKNCSTTTVAPSNVGQKIKISTSKNFPYIIQNNARTIKANNFDRLYTSIKGNKFIIDGTLSISTGKVNAGAVTNEPIVSLKYYLKQYLAKHNIDLRGKILVTDRVPSDKRNLKEISSISKDMENISKIAMKKSDNFITDYLLAEFATQNNQNEWRFAASSMKDLVKRKFGTDLTRSEIIDGSGISRLNLLTVNQFDSFLNFVSQKPNFSKIKSLLATPSEDCTLQDRMDSKMLIYAKTGTLSNVSTLVGYFYNKNNELHSFVIMMNNFCGSNIPYRKLEEQILRLVM
ncbi:D-alanyl-D-alanine carboxypeptidase/D-alanyl-D-alanine-endopeptidase [Rickettsiaceae bacterium]|nr:D-alanyl-D-alanine carboxypeptidase/D-alanyl-D-alanine-endopeptidase [Rickettsiaceae bacterium]